MVTDRAFECFFAHFQPYVRAYATRRVAASAVDDVVSEVFAVAWRRRDVVPDDALPWLYATARNTIGTRRRGEERAAAAGLRLAALPPEVFDDPLDALEAHARLERALQVLSHDDRELLLLAAWEGLAPREIGEVLGITAGAASVRLHRARRRLAESLGESEQMEREP